MSIRNAVWGVLLCAGLCDLGCQGASPGGGPPTDPSLTDGGMVSGGDDGGSSQSQVTSLITQAIFEQIFLHRGTAPCQGSFYTYQAFVSAAQLYPDFAGQGTVDDRRREVAAFLANISHETTGGWATAPDGPYSWGLCWINEGATVDPKTLPDYCSPSVDWPCKPGKKYFGRGPIQISWNYNYGQAGKALGIDLLSSPELVAMDAALAFKTALWFWMTPQSPKPSCHDVMTGRYVPTATDVTAGRVAGFGLTVNIINGGIECNQPTPAQVTDRIGFYQRYVQLLGTTPGTNLTCDKMKSY